jgi:ferredoxin-type protein NapG
MGEEERTNTSQDAIPGPEAETASVKDNSTTAADNAGATGDAAASTPAAGVGDATTDVPYAGTGKNPQPKVDRPSVSRRGFVIGLTGTAALLALGTVKFLPADAVCRPPGAQRQEQFIGACIRCQKCIEACPTGVIVPSHIEDGVAQMRTPKLNYSRSAIMLDGKTGWCDHCQAANNGVARCIQVCPSGALDSGLDSNFETMRLGVAKIDQETCLAWRLKGCTICKNACPLEAISFDSSNRPIVDENICNGCGACEQVCVSLENTSVGEGENARQVDERAIVVRAL